jgi:mRNA interferase RelE/StbE
MHVEFLKTFSNDLDSLSQKSIKESVAKIITLVERAENIWEIPHVIKLKGHKHAYRIRLGDYRIGIFVEGNTVEFARVLHRSAIYKMFP